MVSASTKRVATQLARKLRDRMKGKGWKIRVWENLGWHYEVHNGPISVWPGTPGMYHCLISANPEQAGAGAGVWAYGGEHVWGKDPNKVVAAEIGRVDRSVALFQLVAEAAHKAVA